MPTPFPLAEWRSRYKVVYYPELGYMVSRQRQKGIVDTGWVESQVGYHVTQIKTLAQYFDFILIPFSHFLTAIDEASRALYLALFGDGAFQTLLHRRLVIASTWSGASLNDELTRHAEFLRETGWPVPLYLPSKAKDVLESLLVYQRNVSGQSAFLQQRLRESAETNRPYLGSAFATIKQLLEESPYKDLFPLNHEMFVWRLAARHDARIDAFLHVATTDYLRSGEEGNPGSVIYYLGDADDSITRRAAGSEIYAFLYSPAFWIRFLELFLDKRLVMHVPRLDVSAIADLRCLECWKPAIDRYHDLLTYASDHLQDHMYHDTGDVAIAALERRIQAIEKDNMPFEFGLTALLSIVGAYTKVSAAIPTPAREALRRAANRLHLRFADEPLFMFLKELSSRLKLIAP